MTPEKLPYCGNGSYEAYGQSYTQHQCVYYDEYRVAFPQESSLLAVTRMSNQARRPGLSPCAALALCVAPRSQPRVRVLAV